MAKQSHHLFHPLLLLDLFLLLLLLLLLPLPMLLLLLLLLLAPCTTMMPTLLMSGASWPDSGLWSTEACLGKPSLKDEEDSQTQ